MRTHKTWCAAALSLGILGAAGCTKEIDLKGTLSRYSTPTTSDRAVEAVGSAATTRRLASDSATMLALSAIESAADEQPACVASSAAKTSEVLGFLHAANRAELAKAKLAKDHARSEALKARADDVMRDRAALDFKLQTVAWKEGIDVTPPKGDPVLTGLKKARDEQLATLATKTGRSFDEAYLAPDVSEDAQDLDVVEQGRKLAQDDEVRAVLTDARRVIRQDEERAMALEDDQVSGGAAQAPTSAIFRGAIPSNDVTPGRGLYGGGRR
jgi:predicted outer membrane protein